VILKEVLVRERQVGIGFGAIATSKLKNDLTTSKGRNSDMSRR
jgi:hypothetical protein